MAKPHAQDCPIAQLLNVIGDHWSLLIIREAFYGASRFSEFERNTGIAKNLLTDRLSALVEAGVLEKRNVSVTATRFAYFLTERGDALLPILVAMVQWSNKYLSGSGKESVRVVERASGRAVMPLVLTGRGGAALSSDDIAVVPGPRASKAIRRRLAQIPQS